MTVTVQQVKKAMGRVRDELRTRVSMSVPGSEGFEFLVTHRLARMRSDSFDLFSKGLQDDEYSLELLVRVLNGEDIKKDWLRDRPSTQEGPVWFDQEHYDSFMKEGKFVI